MDFTKKNWGKNEDFGIKLWIKICPDETASICNIILIIYFMLIMLGTMPVIKAVKLYHMFGQQWMIFIEKII